MATLTEIETAMFTKLRNYYHGVILSELQQASQAIPDFVGDNVHKHIFIDALNNLTTDNEFVRAVIAEARTKLFNAIQALPAQTKIDLGIDHLFE